jgi:hypothetical protein
MPLETTYPHIENPPGEPARLKRLPRIRVAQIVMDYLAHGWSAEEIHRQQPHLTLAEVHSALAFYHDHREQIEREIEEEVKQVERSATGAVPSVVARLRTRKST